MLLLSLIRPACREFKPYTGRHGVLPAGASKWASGCYTWPPDYPHRPPGGQRSYRTRPLDKVATTSRGHMQLRQERQANPVADDVSALIAVTRPIVAGLLHSVSAEQLEPHGGPKGIKLGRVRAVVFGAGDGTIGAGSTSCCAGRSRSASKSSTAR